MEQPAQERHWLEIGMHAERIRIVEATEPNSSLLIIARYSKHELKHRQAELFGAPAAIETLCDRYRRVTQRFATVTVPSSEWTETVRLVRAASERLPEGQSEPSRQCGMTE